MDPHHGIMKAFPKVKRAKVLQGKDPPPAKKKPEECDITGCYQSGKRKWELKIVDLTLNIVHTHAVTHTGTQISYSTYLFIVVFCLFVFYQETHLLVSQHMSCLLELETLDTKSFNDKSSRTEDGQRMH